MPHNPHLALESDFTLPDHAVLTLEGPDALAFAQAQFMNDVAALADGEWQWNGWLTPKGRVVALFAVLRLDVQTLWLLLPDVGATEFAPLLQRYVFRSKVSLTVVDTPITANFEAPSAASGASFVILEDGGLELDMHGEGGARRLRIGGTPDFQHATEAVAAWNQADLAHGLPRLPASQREQWTPQQLSLDRLRAFSVKKGCYPGQEIVARTHFLGQVKRGLGLFETASEVPAGSDLQSEGRTLGSVVCASGTLALAVVPLDAPTEGLEIAGTTVQTRTLLGGLAR